MSPEAKLLIAVIIFLSCSLILFYILKNNDKKIENYGSIVKHDPFPLPLKDSSVGDLVAQYQNYRGEITKASLLTVLGVINPGENFGLMQSDNDIKCSEGDLRCDSIRGSFRRGFQNIDIVKTVFVPFCDKILNKRGLKISKNKFDDNPEQPILKIYQNGQDFPLGYWMFVSKIDETI